MPSPRALPATHQPRQSETGLAPPATNHVPASPSVAGRSTAAADGLCANSGQVWLPTTALMVQPLSAEHMASSPNSLFAVLKKHEFVHTKSSVAQAAKQS